jgi:hypothetical protein
MKKANLNNITKVKIKNLCSRKIWGLEFYVKKIVEKIGYSKFRGIESIILLDEVSILTYDLPEDITKLISRQYRMLGYYLPGYLSRSPHIVLFIHEIYRGIPFPLYLMPIVVLKMTKALTHELGHHLITYKQKIISDNKEEIIIGRYTRGILGQLIKNPQFRFWNWCLRELSSWHFAFAKADYKLNDLANAEKHFYTSWQLDPKNEEAAEWYWYIKKGSSNNSDS